MFYLFCNILFKTIKLDYIDNVKVWYIIIPS